jgi:hypothetical protein
MSPEGGGPVMPALENLADNKNLFSLGIIDKQTGDASPLVVWLTQS